MMPEGYDPSAFDTSALDSSAFDLSVLLPEEFDPENPDPTLLAPQSISTSGEIGPEGGDISVTGKNGVTYTLSVPPGALPSAQWITLTPVANIDGLPFSGGFVGAVHIDPRGIEFSVPALLAIDVPQSEEPLPGAIDIAFGYENMGGTNSTSRQFCRRRGVGPPDPGQARRSPRLSRCGR